MGYLHTFQLGKVFLCLMKEVQVITQPPVYYPRPEDLILLQTESKGREQLISDVTKAGFNVETEYRRRSLLIDKFGSHKGNYLWITGVTDEVVEHAFEYSRKDPVRQAPSYELLNGRLYSPRFDEYASIFTSPLEREGSVHEGLLTVEDKLKESPYGSYVVWSSPKGWIGAGDNKYDYSWTHIFWKEKQDTVDKARYVSVRSDFSLQEHAQLLNCFLEDDKQLSSSSFEFESKEGIKTILKTPVVANVSSLEEFATVFALLKGFSGALMYKDRETGVSYTVSQTGEILRDISKATETERDVMQPLINQYEQRLAHANTKEQKEAIMAEYVLAANSFWRRYTKTSSVEHIMQAVRKDMTSGFARGSMLTSLQLIGGCGTNSLRQNTTMFTNQVFEEKNPNNTIEEPFSCPSCHFATYEKVGDKCPRCGLTRKDHAKSEREKGNPVCD